MYTFY